MRALPLELAVAAMTSPAAAASAGDPHRALRRRILAKARRLEDAADDDQQAQAQNGGGGSQFDFDPTAHSLAYHRCASVRQFDDDLAASGASSGVFATKHFAVVRLCPSDTCDERSAYASYYSNDGIFDRVRYSGANGYGCQSNYGQYILELGDYLEIMADYHAERFEQYCAMCKSCLYDAYQSWVDGWDSERRELKEMDDPSWRDELESVEFKRHRELDFNPYEYCPQYDTCKSYQNVCANGVDDSNVQYFQCTAVVGGDGSTYYIGPHCSSNAITITLGVFSDEACNEYMGNSFSVEDVLGYQIDENTLFETYLTGSVAAEMQQLTGNYTSTATDLCIPCMVSNQLYESYGSSNNDDDDGQNQYSNNNGGVSQICETLYDSSARCDRDIRRYNSNNYNSYQDTDEVSTCNYIDAIVHGSFDSMGFVLTNYSLDTYLLETTQGTAWEEVSFPQMFGLAATLAACVGLGMWALALSGCKLMKRKSRKERYDDDTTFYTAPSMESEAIETAMLDDDLDPTSIGSVSITSRKGKTEVKALQKEIAVLRKQLHANSRRRHSTPTKSIYSDDASDVSSYYSSSHGSESSYTKITRGGRSSKFPRARSETPPTAAADPELDLDNSSIFSKITTGIAKVTTAAWGDSEKLPVVSETDEFLASSINKMNGQPGEEDGSVATEAPKTSASGVQGCNSETAVMRGKQPSRLSLDIKRSQSTARKPSLSLDLTRSKSTPAKAKSPKAKLAPKPTPAAAEGTATTTVDQPQQATFLPRATSLSANIAALHAEINDMQKELREEHGLDEVTSKAGSLAGSEKSRARKGRIKKMFSRKGK